MPWQKRRSMVSTIIAQTMGVAAYQRLHMPIRHCRIVKVRLKRPNALPIYLPNARLM